jgi:hypothetical protein
MEKLYEVTVKILDEQDDGRIKAVKEKHLVSAMTIKEAILLVEKDFAGLMADWEISDVKESKIASVINYKSQDTDDYVGEM